MEQRKLGSQGFSVSAEGLGCMGMSAFYGPSDEAENLSTLARAIELGVDFFDTAEIYGPFKNEILLSKAFAGKRDKVKIATKVGSEVTDAGERRDVNGTAAYIKTAIDRSLRHLGTDYVDLYYLHRIDPKVEIEESIGALKDFVKAGKVRYIGVSEAAPATLRRAHKVHPLTALQTEYSLFERSPESNGVLDTVRELGIGFVPYSPLGRGLLTGADQNHRRPRGPATSAATIRAGQGGQFREHNLKLVGRIKEMAARKGVTAVAIGADLGDARQHGADPGHPPAQISRGKRGGCRRHVDRGGSAGDRRGGAGRRGGGRPLFAAGHGVAQSLTAHRPAKSHGS